MTAVPVITKAPAVRCCAVLCGAALPQQGAGAGRRWLARPKRASARALSHKNPTVLGVSSLAGGGAGDLRRRTEKFPFKDPRTSINTLFLIEYCHVPDNRKV
jgi:hypothetical protein